VSLSGSSARTHPSRFTGDSLPSKGARSAGAKGHPAPLRRRHASTSLMAELPRQEAEAESAAAPWGEPEQLSCEGEGARDEPPRDKETEAESAAAPWGEPEQLSCEGEGARDEPPRDTEAESAAAPWGEPEQLSCEGEGARDEPPRDKETAGANQTKETGPRTKARAGHAKRKVSN